MDKTKLIAVGVVVAVVLSGLAFFKDGKQGPQGPQGPSGVTAGAIASPALGPWFSVGGVEYYGATVDNLTQASTSVCQLNAPASTSSLAFASLQLTKGTSSALYFDFTKQANRTAATSTGTKIGTTYTLASGLQGTILATTSPEAPVFSPNDWLTVRYTGSQGTDNGLIGTCKAVWIRH